MSEKLKCQAKTRQGHLCKLPAGFGTDHVGSGRCKFHGGKSPGSKPGNKSAERHGFYSKHLPAETAELMNEIKDIDPLDMLWDSIVIQWAAILRAQKLMYVKTQRDHTRSKVGYSQGNVVGEKWEVQHAWDKQEQFLNAQSRALATLGAQIERYDKLCRSGLATEEQQARIDNLKARVTLMEEKALELEDLSDTDSLVFGGNHED